MDSHKTLVMVDEKWGANVRTDPSLTRGIFSTHPNLFSFLTRAPDLHQGHLHPQLRLHQANVADVSITWTKKMTCKGGSTKQELSSIGGSWDVVTSSSFETGTITGLIT
ncbi:hypothetical protein UY3_16090 [Chelonia mydas]|uniref:Uncharacterized protein n=1 Tax=Chelonia mydas TaxID=8469 RepID=M7ANM4_CHEMY|nr:hypothetical protein UY3_16090 [Chelonia mydas]